MEQLKYRNSYIVFKEEFGKMGSLNEAVMYAPSEMPTLISDFWKSYHELPSVLERQGLKSEQKRHGSCNPFVRVKSNSGYVWNRSY